MQRVYALVENLGFICCLIFMDVLAMFVYSSIILVNTFALLGKRHTEQS